MLLKLRIKNNPLYYYSMMQHEYLWLKKLTLTLKQAIQHSEIRTRKKITAWKITIFRREILFGYSSWKKCNGDKKIVKATNDDRYFNRYNCSPHRNNAGVSTSHFVTVTKSLVCVKNQRKNYLKNRYLVSANQKKHSLSNRLSRIQIKYL